MGILPKDTIHDVSGCIQLFHLWTRGYHTKYLLRHCAAIASNVAWIWFVGQLIHTVEKFGGKLQISH